MGQEPNYQIKPRSSEQFPRRRMQAILEHTITGRLEGEEYDAERAPQMTREIVELIQRKVIDAMHFFESDDNEKNRWPIGTDSSRTCTWGRTATRASRPVHGHCVTPDGTCTCIPPTQTSLSFVSLSFMQFTRHESKEERIITKKTRASEKLQNDFK